MEADQSPTTLNPDSTNPKPLEAADRSHVVDEAYLDWRVEVARELRAAGHDEQAYNLEHCGKFIGNFTVLICKGNIGHQAHALPFHCQLPVCMPCQRVNQAKRVKSYNYKFEKFADMLPVNQSLKKIVLTTPHNLRHPDARKIRRHYWKLVGKFMQRVYTYVYRHERTPREIKRGRIDLIPHKAGYSAAEEYGEDSQLLHFHLIANMTHIKKQMLSDWWREITGGEAYIVHVRHIHLDRLSRELREQVKYSTKFQKLSPKDAVTLFEILKGEKRQSKRVRLFGYLRTIKPPAKEPCKCKECESPITPITINTYYKLSIERNSAVDPDLVALTPDDIRRHWTAILDLKPPASVGAKPALATKDLFITKHSVNVGGGVYQLPNLPISQDDELTSLREKLRRIARSDPALVPE